MARCAVGGENATYKVYVQLEHEPSVLLYEIALMQTRHVGDEVATYYVYGTDGANITPREFFKGLPRPGRLPHRPDSIAALTTLSHYIEGADIWESTGITLNRRSSRLGVEIEVHGYWEDHRTCKGSTACFSLPGSPI